MPHRHAVEHLGCLDRHRHVAVALRQRGRARPAAQSARSGRSSANLPPQLLPERLLFLDAGVHRLVLASNLSHVLVSERGGPRSVCDRATIRGLRTTDG
eukprot:2521061-Prymnesium_polylepis.1